MDNHGWLYAAIGAAALWAIVNLCDKILLTQSFKSITARMFIDASVGLVTCIPLISLMGPQDGDSVLLSMGTGLILCLFNFLYYRAIKIADVPATAGYLQILPACTALWGYLFFSEVFVLDTYIGIAVLLIGLVLVSVESQEPSGTIILPGHNSRAFLAYLLPGVLLLSICYALQKKLLLTTSPWTVYVWGRVAVFCVVGFACVISQSVRTKVQEGVLEARATTLIHATLVEITNFGGILLLIIAYARGPMTLVTVAAASQPLFVIILTAIVFRSRNPKALAGTSNSFSIFGFRFLGGCALALGLFLMIKQ